MKRTTLAIVPLLACSTSLGSVVEFTDRAEWEAAVGAFTTIDFILPPDGTPIAGQYSQLGVTFGGFTFSHASGGYIDGWGMHGAGGAWVYLDLPQRWFGIDHPGHSVLDLYSDGELIHTTMVFGGGGLGFFGGVLSTMQFDAVYIYKPEPLTNHVFIDDLHFGALVPGPGALGLIWLSALVVPGRRRR